MYKNLLISILLLIYLNNSHASQQPAYFDSHQFSNVPVNFKGRFVPFDAYARFWLKDFYHQEEILSTHWDAFGIRNGSAQELLLKMAFIGHKAFDQAPLFWIENQAIKINLGLETEKEHFSYDQLYEAIYHKKSIDFFRPLLIFLFFQQYSDSANRTRSEKIELSSLATGLWVGFDGEELVVKNAPSTPPWQMLPRGTLLAHDAKRLAKQYQKEYKNVAEASLTLLAAMQQYAQISTETSDLETQFETAWAQLKQRELEPQEIAILLERQYPLYHRLSHAGSLLKILPGRQGNGEWLSINALKTRVYDPLIQDLTLVKNFTLYPDELFASIRTVYFSLEQAIRARSSEIPMLIDQLAELLHAGYKPLAGQAYKQAAGKVITYPSLLQLKTESLYYILPLSAGTAAAYMAAFVLFTLGIYLRHTTFSAAGKGLILCAFLLHTVLLGMRCYILQRPPVSNMLETIIYVPWVAVLISLITYLIWRNVIVLASSSFLGALLLTVPYFSALNRNFENIQAVLDSQYWLTIHVLMVVGSYGAFALCTVLGHLYLIGQLFWPAYTLTMRFLSKSLLQTMYVGVAMLIPGTILGGVWAAESWGRFWDWDPKEAWAFISICVYVMWIHAYRFQHIHAFGLAIGSVVGFLAISFTWYGVNYILGTGLHSYGFGSGGEQYYYLFLIIECLFLFMIWFNKYKENQRSLSDKRA